MAVHNNLKLFYLLLLLLLSLLLPCHSTQPQPPPSPATRGSRSSLRPALGLSPLSGPAPSDNYIDDDIDSEEHDNSISPSSSIDPSPSASMDPQVKKICDSTDYPSICLATVSPNLHGETDIPAVLDVAIQACAQYTNYGQTTAQKLARNPRNSPQLNAVLHQCSDGFGKAMEKYGKARDAIPEQDKSTLNTTLIVIVAFVAECRDTNSQDSKLYSISERLISMTLNCLAITSLME